MLFGMADVWQRLPLVALSQTGGIAYHRDAA
jgi:hypothetical protein